MGNRGGRLQFYFGFALLGGVVSRLAGGHLLHDLEKLVDAPVHFVQSLFDRPFDRTGSGQGLIEDVLPGRLGHGKRPHVAHQSERPAAEHLLDVGSSNWSLPTYWFVTSLLAFGKENGIDDAERHGDPNIDEERECARDECE